MEILSRDHPSNEETIRSLDSITNAMDSIRLNITSKFNKDAPSSIWIEVSLSETEIEMLLQLFFKCPINKDSIDESLRELV